MNRRKFLQGLLAVIWAGVIASSIAGIAQAAGSTRDLTAFQDSSYIYIATVRKDGKERRHAFRAPAARYFIRLFGSDKSDIPGLGSDTYRDWLTVRVLRSGVTHRSR